MKRYMDELVESCECFVVDMGECAIEMGECLVKLFLLITFFIWYLPYKFFRRKRTKMKCGFNRGTRYEECTEKCKYFDTCTRNPHKKHKKDGLENGRCEVDKNND